ncbi:MAG: thioredoxin [Myxococcota bacterium]
MSLPLRTCPSCGAKNRVPTDHIVDTGRCGRCQTALPAQSTPVDVDAAAFDRIIKGSKKPVLVDFWAPWCGPCRMAAPEVEKAARALQGEALVVKVNTEDEPGLATRYGVRGIPMFVVLEEGALVRQQTGLIDAKRLVEMVRAG